MASIGTYPVAQYPASRQAEKTYLTRSTKNRSPPAPADGGRGDRKGRR